MKSYGMLVIILALALVSGFAYAEMTGTSEYGNYLDTIPVLQHEHNYDQYNRGAELGLGVDVTVYEFDGVANSWGAESVEIQQKYDMNNGEYECYGVVQLNLWKVVKKLMK